MTHKKYDEELKGQILKECNEIGNISVVARRYNLSSKTIYNWISAAKKRGSVEPLPRNPNKRLSEIEKCCKAYA